MITNYPLLRNHLSDEDILAFRDLFGQKMADEVDRVLLRTCICMGSKSTSFRMRAADEIRALLPRSEKPTRATVDDVLAALALLREASDRHRANLVDDDPPGGEVWVRVRKGGSE